MKQFIISCVALFLLALALAGCGTSSTQGPMAWLDEPLDGAALPLEPTEIMAHASDADGVASIEFLINDVPLARAPTDGGVLAEATVGWDPQGPGTYTVRARGTDSQGNVGAEAVSVVTVGRVEGSPTPLPTERPTEEVVTQETHSPGPPTVTPMVPTGTPRPTAATAIPPTRTPLPPTATPQPPARRPEIAYFEANPGTISQGQCSTLSWGVDYAAEVYMEGEGVGDHDARQVCPATSTSYTLFARSPGGEQQASATVTVIQAPTPTPVVVIITPQRIDTTPPEVWDLGAAPASISSAGSQCGPTKTTTISVYASDLPSGVAGVVAYWTLEYQSGQANMISYGGGLYQVVLGPFDLTGNLAVTVVARDTVNNYTGHIGPTTVLVHCIG